MDTQGGDLEHFAGATPVLGSIVALQSEMAFHKIYAGSPAFEEALAYFQAARLRLSVLYPISLNEKFVMSEAAGVVVKC